jgi:sugar phosphate permease
VLGYVHLFRAAGDILAFGFALTFLAAFGQTFFVGLFASEVRAAFGLTHGGFGGIFSAATLASGFLLIWAGGLIDRMPAGAYATLAMLGLAAAALLFALAPSALVLGLAIFLLRLTGQGMLSHAAATTMARLQASVRGKALSIALLGHPAGQAVFPALVLAAIALLGWRPTWAFAAVIAGIAAVVLVVARRRGLDRRLHESTLPVEAGSAARPSSDRRAVLADWRFYWLLPSVITSSAVNTGLVFHQRLIAEVKGWPLSLLAASMTTYALASVAGSMVAGLLVDRFRAVALLPFYLLALGAAGILLGVLDHPFLAPIFFGLLGLSSGSSHTVVGAVWAEIYGTRHLGAIRAMVHAIMVCSSALTPGLMGVLLDAGVTVEAIGIVSGLLVLALSIANTRLLGAVPRQEARRRHTGAS